MSKTRRLTTFLVPWRVWTFDPWLCRLDLGSSARAMLASPPNPAESAVATIVTFGSAEGPLKQLGCQWTYLIRWGRHPINLSLKTSISKQEAAEIWSMSIWFENKASFFMALQVFHRWCLKRSTNTEKNMKKHSPHQPQVDVEDLGPVAPKPLQIGKHILFSYIAENLHCWCLQHIAILLCKKQVWNCRVHHYSFLLHELISPNERNVCRKWTILPRVFTTSNIRVVTCELGLGRPVGCQKKTSLATGWGSLVHSSYPNSPSQIFKMGHQ